jgi:hypothetical protein
MMEQLQLNPSWNLIFEDNQLVLSAGGDEMYLVDELNEKQAQEFYEAFKTSTGSAPIQLAEKEPFKSFTKNLLASGILFKGTNITTPATKVTYNITWYGNRVDKIENHIARLLDPDLIEYSETEQHNDSHLHILIRSNAAYHEVLDVYKIQGKQLFFDLAYRNHISIGPFVNGGETACVSCFIGRINRNWGDPQPPHTPAVHNDSAFISSLIVKYLSQYREYGRVNRLVGHVMQMNSTSFETQYDRVLRLPWCPHCFPYQEDTYGTGSFELPWLNS